MALPNSRDITLAPGTQIPSSLLNNLQDFLIDGRFHATTTKIVHASKGQGSAGYASGRTAIGAGEFWDLPLDVVASENISSYAVVITVFTNGDQTDMQLIRRTGGGAESVQDTTACPTTVATHEVFNLFFGAVIIGGSDTFIIRVSCDGGNTSTVNLYHGEFSSQF